MSWRARVFRRARASSVPGVRRFHRVLDTRSYRTCVLTGFENQLRDSLRMYCMHAAKAEEETVSADCGEARVELAWGPDAQTIRCESVGLVR